MTETFDLEPAAGQLKLLVRAVADDQLDSRTPCPDWSVGDLLDHIRLLSMAFTAAASKSAFPPESDRDPGGADGDDRGQPRAADLPTDWRELISQQLDELVAAWRQPDAWQGMAEAGGVTLPAEVIAMVAVNELVMHGWDLARATGQPVVCDPVSEQVSYDFATQSSAQSDGAGTDGLFGASVPVSTDAPLLQQALAHGGRDPDWQP